MYTTAFCGWRLCEITSCKHPPLDGVLVPQHTCSGSSFKNHQNYLEVLSRPPCQTNSPDVCPITHLELVVGKCSAPNDLPNCTSEDAWPIFFETFLSSWLAHAGRRLLLSESVRKHARHLSPRTSLGHWRKIISCRVPVVCVYAASQDLAE